MKILVVGPHWHANWTESVRDALLSLSCEAQVCYYNQTPGRQVASDARIRFSNQLLHRWIKAPNIARQLLWVINGQELHRLLMAAVHTTKPDLIIVLKGESILPATLRAMKQELVTPPILTVWYVDNPLRFDERDTYWLVPRCAPLYDRMFIFDLAYFDAMHKLGNRHITHLPCAFDPIRYRPEPPPLKRSAILNSTVCLVGTANNKRVALLQAMQDIPGIAVWGDGWGQYKQWPWGGSNIDAFRGGVLPAEQASLAYQSAKIVLNSHHPQTKRGGLNMRAFEVPACGAFQLMDYVPEMEALLQPGHDVAVYRTPQEAGTLARAYLADPEARQRIARQGHARVLAEHTYRHRMQTLLAAL